MKTERLLKESDIEVLRRHALHLNHEVEALYRKLAQLRAELAVSEGKSQVEIEFVVNHLMEQLAEHTAEKFSSSASERRGRPEGAEAEPAKEERKKTGHGPTSQPNLPIKVLEHALPPEERKCGHCEGELVEQPALASESDQITVEARIFHILRHRQLVYSCDTCGSLDMAPKPDLFNPGGRYTEDIAAQVVVDKYADHIPLERQVERMKRGGLTVTSQTLWDQEARLMELLQPTGVALHQWMLSSHDVLGADETWWRMMGKGASQKWWAWSLTAPDGVYFDLLPGRGKDAARLVLQDFHGIIVADGYSVYDTLQHEASKSEGTQLLISGEAPQKLSDFLLACCWAHARRYFVKAEKNYSQVGKVLDKIAALYAVEAEATRRAEAGEDLFGIRRELRASRSRPIVEEIHRWLQEQRPPPGLQFDKAVNYALNRWPALQVFLDHPEVPIDNSATERAIRGPVLGRLNFQGVRSVAGARAASLFYSLIGTCKRLDVDPFAYLVFAARRAMADRKAVTLPHEFKALLAKSESESSR